ncbi:hypothetical protein G6F61_005856 [Rhizopus arrhizus]|nr:hypothetical protein G6F61_005856 [Rhizopus arrhizus]
MNPKETIRQVTKVHGLCQAKLEILRAKRVEGGAQMGRSRSDRTLLFKKIMIKKTKNTAKEIGIKAVKALVKEQERKRRVALVPRPSKMWSGDNWATNSPPPSKRYQLHGCYL